MTKRLKLKVRKFLGLVLTFGEVTEEKLVGGGAFAHQDGDKSYPQLFLEEALCDEKTQPKACRQRYKQKINVCSMSSNKMVVLVVTRRRE